MMALVTVGFALFVLAHPTSAATTRVRCDQGENLQVAIDAADLRDMLIVQGRCVGSFYLSKSLVLVGADAGTTLDGEHQGVVLTLGQLRPDTAEPIRIDRLRVTGGDVGLLVGESVTAELTELWIDRNHTGIALEPFSNVSLSDSNVESNTGNGIENDHGRLEIRDSTVRGNSRHGIESQQQGQTAVHGSRIEGNGDRGIVNLNAATSLTGSTIRGNAGGGVFSDGRAYLSVTDSVIAGNAAARIGGGLYLAAPSDPIDGQVLVRDTIVRRNSAGVSGGGLYVEEGIGAFTLSGVLVAHNSAGETGGGIYQAGGPLSAAGVIFRSNEPDDCRGCR